MQSIHNFRCTDHWFDWRVFHRLELVILELIVGPNVDVRALVLRAIAIPRRREHLTKVSKRRSHADAKRSISPVMHRPSCSTSYPSMRTSCERMTASKPFFSQKRFVTSGPNCKPTPRLLGPRPGCGCGSVHSISIMRPLWPGWRWRWRSSLRTSSRDTASSENSPPCSVRKRPPISVASGSAENDSENSLNTRSVYLCRHSPSKPYIRFMSSVSWLPRLRKNVFGYSHL